MAGHGSGPDGLVCLLAVLHTRDRDLEVAWHVCMVARTGVVLMVFMMEI